MASVCVALVKKCWCKPSARFDRCVATPEKGAGTMPTQFQSSLLPAGVAPAGRKSSTQTVSSALGVVAEAGAASSRTTPLKTPAAVGLNVIGSESVALGFNGIGSELGNCAAKG